MTSPQRMASADAAWLHMDRPTNLMVVNSVFWFDRPVDWDRVAGAFAERLVPSFPRFGQRAVEPPITLGLLVPRWETVDGFDVEQNLRRVRLAAPGDDAVLHEYVSTQADLPLDPRRPLWEAHLIDGYGAGCAVLLRTHHAIADGTALVQALLTLVDEPPDGVHPGQPPLEAHATPHRGLPREPAPPTGDGDGDGDGRSFVTRAVDAVRLAGDRRVMLHRLGFARADDDSPLRGELSGRKQLTWSSAIPLEPVKAAGRRSGATVNDLALAVVAGALRRYLQAQGREVGRLTAVVPVNLRPLDEPMDPLRGNQFGLAFVPLPVREPDPAARLAAVRARMNSVKATGEGVVTSGALAVMGHTPVQVEQKFLDLFAGRATAVITNIAGPRSEVSLAGVPLAGFTAWVPSTGPIGVGLSICSYAGRLLLGVAVDDALVPDAAQLLAALHDEVEHLREIGPD